MISLEYNLHLQGCRLPRNEVS